MYVLGSVDDEGLLPGVLQSQHDIQNLLARMVSMQERVVAAISDGSTQIDTAILAVAEVIRSEQS